MEIERKWRTDGWPQGLEEVRRIVMRQGYITTVPTHLYLLFVPVVHSMYRLLF